MGGPALCLASKENDMDLLQIHEDGQEAFWLGKAATDNPHPSGSEASGALADGFNDPRD